MLISIQRLGLQFSYSITLWNRATIRTETVRSIFNFLFSFLYTIFSETSFEAHKDFLMSSGTHKWFLMRCFVLLRVPCAISTMLRLDHTKFWNLEAKRHPFFNGLANNASWNLAHCSYFSSLLRARKNTTQLAKYLRVLYVKPLNELYILTFWGPRAGLTLKYHGDTNVWFSLPFQCRWKENLSNWSS